MYHAYIVQDLGNSQDLMPCGCDQDCVLPLCRQAAIPGDNGPIVLPSLVCCALLHKDWLYGERLAHLHKALVTDLWPCT